LPCNTCFLLARGPTVSATAENSKGQIIYTPAERPAYKSPTISCFQRIVRILGRDLRRSPRLVLRKVYKRDGQCSARGWLHGAVAHDSRPRATHISRRHPIPRGGSTTGNVLAVVISRFHSRWF